MPERIKILLIIPSLRAGGAERITTTIAKNLNKKRFDVHLLVIDSSNAFFSFNDSDNISIIDLKIKRVRYSIFVIVKIVRKIKPDLIFSTITHLNTYLCLFKPIFFSKVGLIIRESNVLQSFLDKKISPSNKYFLTLQKIVYPKAQAIVCQSEAMKKEMNTLLAIPENKLVVINNPVLLRSSVQKKSVKKFDIIAVGNFSKIKGYERMIEAISLLSDSNISLGIIGDGQERENIEKGIERLGLNDRVCLLGRQKQPSAFMKSAKVLLITSYYEGFPNVVLEAGMVGLPVVGFKMPGGISEIIQDGKNGFLAKNGDITDLVQNIEKALRYNFDIPNIIANTSKRFSVESIIPVYENLFTNLISFEKK